MRHRELNASEITRLVSEANFAKTVERNFHDLIYRVQAYLYNFFPKQRRLEKSELISLMKGVDDLVQTGMMPLETVFETTHATSARPKGEKILYKYLCLIMPEQKIGGEYAQLYTAQILATRREVRLEWRKLPILFNYHAAERLLERDKEVTGSFSTLAITAVDWMATLLADRHNICDALDNTFTIPVEPARGVILGDYIEKQSWFGMRYVINKMGVFTTQIDVQCKHSFVVRTFVDRHQLYPEQRYAAFRLSRWRQENEALLRRFNDSMAYPSISEDSLTGTDNVADDALEELYGILSDKIVNVGMRRERIAQSAKVPDCAEWSEPTLTPSSRLHLER